MVRKLFFDVRIEAPAHRVYTVMLAPDTFREWTSAFDPTSHFEGGWEKGSKMRFLGIGPDGKKMGMVGHIEENIPDEYVSIRYDGVVDGEQEVTSGPDAEGWVGAHENYTFKKVGENSTRLFVEVDTKEEYVEHFTAQWPDALARLKRMCE